MVVLRPDEEFSELESLSMTIKLCSVKEKKVLLLNPNPAGIGDPIAVTYIPVCENTVQIESVSSVYSSFVSKGIIF